MNLIKEKRYFFVACGLYITMFILDLLKKRKIDEIFYDVADEI
jgi:hypothetical protein